MEWQKATKSGGYLILSGILDKKEDLVKVSFKDLALKKRILKDEWVTLIYQKDIHG
ncbi:MAG: 50S ribosomal protein L11 methyltransferase [Sulfurovum sp.]|nr:50S ribosomal protein L11 methyltransferase [Sulfurovum sp.]